jgi:lipid-binding SYLF domain-containing protein
MMRVPSRVARKLHVPGIIAALILLFYAGVPPLASGADDAKKKEEARADIVKMSDATLSRLYKAQPQAKTAVAKAAGYAVFSNFGMKIFVAGSGTGKGVAVNNSTKNKTYMKMVEIQAGLGIGVKKFRLVWVFEKQKDLDAFINSGWELGGQTSAAAQASSQGAAFAGAMSVAPGIWLYQLTDDGLALELTAKGTKYYKDGDLN